MHKPFWFNLSAGLLLLVTACSQMPKGVVGQVTKASKEGLIQECTFYNNGKEVAKIFFDEKGQPAKTEGQIPDGPVKMLKSDGKVSMEMTYLNNLKDGPYKIYNTKEGVSADGFFKAGQIDGVNKTYNEKGVAATARTYQAGVLNGPSQWFYEDGVSVKVEKNYKMGKEEGKFFWKTQDGKVTATEIYKNGWKVK